MDAGWFRLREAKLYTLPERAAEALRVRLRPEGGADRRALRRRAVDARRPRAGAGDHRGLRESCREHGREPGEIIFQAGFASAGRRAARDRGAKWKPTQMPEVYLEDIHDPAEMQRGAERRGHDEEFANEGFLVGADPARARRAHPRDGRRGGDGAVPAAHRQRRPARHDPPLRRGGPPGAARRSRLEQSELVAPRAGAGPRVRRRLGLRRRRDLRLGLDRWDRLRRRPGCGGGSAPAAPGGARSPRAAPRHWRACRARRPGGRAGTAAPRASRSSAPPARPCSRVIPVGSPRRSFVAKLPSVQMTRGSISSIWRNR